LLPGDDASDANPYIEIPLATGLGHGRNAVIALAADGVIAIGGGLGTLSEIALALRNRRPAIGLRTWRFDRDHQVEPGLPVAGTAEESLAWLFERLK
jgi:uncharacterized protein (TIGR00725 family)